MIFGRGRGGETGLQKRIVALEEAHDRLEREIKSARLDWEMLLEKMNRMMGRLNARARAKEATTEASPGPDDARRPSQHELLSRGRARHVLSR